MRLTIVSTDQICQVDGVNVRRWLGHDDQGRPYDVMVQGLGTADPAAQAYAEESLLCRLDVVPVTVGCIACEQRAAHGIDRATLAAMASYLAGHGSTLPDHLDGQGWAVKLSEDWEWIADAIKEAQRMIEGGA